MSLIMPEMHSKNPFQTLPRLINGKSVLNTIKIMTVRRKTFKTGPDRSSLHEHWLGLLSLLSILCTVLNELTDTRAAQK